MDDAERITDKEQSQKPVSPPIRSAAEQQQGAQEKALDDAQQDHESNCIHSYPCERPYRTAYRRGSLLQASAAGILRSKTEKCKANFLSPGTSSERAELAVSKDCSLLTLPPLKHPARILIPACGPVSWRKRGNGRSFQKFSGPSPSLSAFLHVSHDTPPSS